MQHFRIISLPMMVLIICCFFLIAYNAHNENYDFFFDSEPIEALELKIKSEDIAFQSSFGQQPENVMVLMPEKINAGAATGFKEILFIK